MHNIGAVEDCMAQSSRRANCPHFDRLPCFWAAIVFPLKSRVFPTVKSFAHNLIHKRCAELAGRSIGGYLARAAAAIPEIRIGNVRGCKFCCPAAKFETFPRPARFLRSRNFPIGINALADSQAPCSQSYPQKMCRTSLAVQLATRYIAAFTAHPSPLNFRSSFCSPFFKLQAGQSGCC